MSSKNSPYALKTQKNRYVKHAHFSALKFKKIILCFVQDLPASKIATFVGLSRQTVNKLLTKIRARLAKICNEKMPLTGQVEVDESYFGATKS